jgi:hypothetical protein
MLLGDVLTLSLRQIAQKEANQHGSVGTQVGLVYNQHQGT